MPAPKHTHNTQGQPVVRHSRTAGKEQQPADAEGNNAEQPPSPYPMHFSSPLLAAALAAALTNPGGAKGVTPNMLLHNFNVSQTVSQQIQSREDGSDWPYPPPRPYYPRLQVPALRELPAEGWQRHAFVHPGTEGMTWMGEEERMMEAGRVTRAATSLRQTTKSRRDLSPIRQRARTFKAGINKTSGAFECSYMCKLGRQ